MGAAKTAHYWDDGSIHNYINFRNACKEITEGERKKESNMVYSSAVWLR